VSCGPADDYDGSSAYPLIHLDELRTHVPPSGIFRARLDADGLVYADGRLDALVAAGGAVSGTRQAHSTRIGVAQVRRSWETDVLAGLHLVFAPGATRPLLLGWVQLLNRTNQPLLVHYSEMWDLVLDSARVADAASIGTTSHGERVLADLGSAPRAAPPDPPAETGLVLDARFVLPPRQIRELTFGYIATPEGVSAAPLVRAWRGAVKSELQRTFTGWKARLGTDLIAAYRRTVQERAPD